MAGREVVGRRFATDRNLSLHSYHFAPQLPLSLTVSSARYTFNSLPFAKSVLTLATVGGKDFPGKESWNFIDEVIKSFRDRAHSSCTFLSIHIPHHAPFAITAHTSFPPLHRSRFHSHSQRKAISSRRNSARSREQHTRKKRLRNPLRMVRSTLLRSRPVLFHRLSRTSAMRHERRWNEPAEQQRPMAVIHHHLCRNGFRYSSLDIQLFHRCIRFCCSTDSQSSTGSHQRPMQHRTQRNSLWRHLLRPGAVLSVARPMRGCRRGEW